MNEGLGFRGLGFRGLGCWGLGWGRVPCFGFSEGLWIR